MLPNDSSTLSHSSGRLLRLEPTLRLLIGFEQPTVEGLCRQPPNAGISYDDGMCYPFGRTTR